MASMIEFTQNEILECLKQVEELKKIKDINLMGKKLGLRKFKKTEKVLAREMIVNKLQELRGENIDMSDSDFESLPDAPKIIDEDDEMEPEEEKTVIKVEEPVEEMTVPAVEEEKPEIVEVPREEEEKDTKNMYKMINQMVENLMYNEEEMVKTQELLEEKTKRQGDTISKLNEEFENLFKKYELTVSENDKLQSSNLKLKEAVRNLMGDL